MEGMEKQVNRWSKKEKGEKVKDTKR